jgi:hypothetical protein
MKGILNVGPAIEPLFLIYMTLCYVSIVILVCMFANWTTAYTDHKRLA